MHGHQDSRRGSEPEDISGTRLPETPASVRFFNSGNDLGRRAPEGGPADRCYHYNPVKINDMMKALGVLAGLVLLLLAAGAARIASLGWAGGHSDVGFWWTVITGFLGIAGAGALVGTAVHARSAD